MIPVVPTEHLVLRGHEVRDFDGYAGFWAGQAAAPFGGPFSRDQAWESFLQDAGHWHIRGFGQWMIELKADGHAIGWVGFVQSVDAAEPELGWTVYPDQEGKNLAYEASIAARAFGASEFGFAHPPSMISAWNTRSIALAERLGATCESERQQDGETVYVYRHPEVVQ